MKIDIKARPSYAMAAMTLEANEMISVEGGSMVALRGMTSNTRMAAGFFTTLARKLLGGESMFLNDFTAGPQGGQLWISPALVGDIVHKKLEGDEIYIQGASFLASGPGIQMKLKWAGLRMLFGSEGAFFWRCSGQGDLLFNAYGAIEEIPVDGKYTIDTGHVVAYSGNLQTKLRTVGGMKSTLFSGEGLVLDFEGQGKVWIQTRSLGSLVKWLLPMLPS